MKTINNKLICEPYKGGKGLKTEVKNAFATVQQKNNLIGLKVLVDCFVSVNSTTYTIKEGSTVYFNEETVHNINSFHNPINNAVLSTPFIVADLNQVVLVCES